MVSTTQTDEVGRMLRDRAIHRRERPGAELSWNLVEFSKTDYFTAILQNILIPLGKEDRKFLKPKGNLPSFTVHLKITHSESTDMS